MQRVALLNGKNKNQDYDVSKIIETLAKSGVGVGLAVTNGSVSTGYAFIQVVRDGKNIMVLFESDTAEAIDTSGTKKVFIEIDQAKVDDGSSNNVTGIGIGEIKTAASYPSTPHAKLASISLGTITDEREYAARSILFRDQNLDIPGLMNFTGGLQIDGNALDTAGGLPTLDEEGKIKGSQIGSPIVKDIQEDVVLGESMVAGNYYYIDPSDDKAYKTNATDPTKITVAGIAQANGGVDDTIKGLTGGTDSNQSGLILDKIHYLSNTPGEISDVKGTNVCSVGIPHNSTKIPFRTFRKEVDIAIVGTANSITFQASAQYVTVPSSGADTLFKSWTPAAGEGIYTISFQGKSQYGGGFKIKVGGVVQQATVMPANNSYATYTYNIETDGSDIEFYGYRPIANVDYQYYQQMNAKWSLGKESIIY